MRRKAPAVVLAAVIAAACGGGGAKPSPSPPSGANKNLGDAFADTNWDIQVLREASATANEVVRSAGDCEAVLPIIAEAKAKLDQAEPRLRTVSGRGTLAALRSRVAKVAEMCPTGGG